MSSRAFLELKDVNYDHIEPIVEVLAKIFERNFLFQIPVGSGDDADVQVYGAYAPNAQNPFFLDHMQELDLHGQGHFTDFIEKHCPAGGGFQQAYLRGSGAGKCAFFVAEQFAADQFLGESAAVEGYARVFPPGA